MGSAEPATKARGHACTEGRTDWSESHFASAPAVLSQCPGVITRHGREGCHAAVRRFLIPALLLCLAAPAPAQVRSAPKDDRQAGDK